LYSDWNYGGHDHRRERDAEASTTTPQAPPTQRDTFETSKNRSKAILKHVDDEFVSHQHMLENAVGLSDAMNEGKVFLTIHAFYGINQRLIPGKKEAAGI
jgi:hypothetical protein